MKKKKRCLLKRFAALVAALVISFSLPVSALAASDTEAGMPSNADFKVHRGSWFVWRTRSVSDKYSYYELCCSPVVFDSSGNLDTNLTSAFSFKSSYFDVEAIGGSNVTYSYACSLPVPLFGFSGWSELPSFPVGFSSNLGTSCLISLYSASSWIDSDYYVSLTPYSSNSSLSVTFSNTSGSSTDSVTAANFPSPLYCFPFAFRKYSSSNVNSYLVVSGDDNCIMFSKSQDVFVSLDSTKFLVNSNTFTAYPDSFTIPSSSLGLVVTKKLTGSGLVTQASRFTPSTECFLVPTLLVPVEMLPNVKCGDWISRADVESLQDQLIKDFGVNSDTLTNSKDNLNSWGSTSSIDSHVADGALGLIDGLFQNLGSFLFSVSLLCFGAVVLRMFIRKAVSG